MLSEIKYQTKLILFQLVAEKTFLIDKKIIQIKWQIHNLIQIISKYY